MFLQQKMMCTKFEDREHFEREFFCKFPELSAGKKMIGGVALDFYTL